ncbi:MAG TPA: DinB family protein [Bacteroidia bacterium]|jgi:hypothetical protein|nr:DinB family protein [Bacteroidia bacterium]
MNEEIENKFKKLENSRKQLIEDLKKFDNRKLVTSPAPGKWSVSQVFYHLDKAESQSVIYVSKKMLDVNNLKKTGFKEAYRTFFLWLGLASPVKFKAPIEALGEMPEKVYYTGITRQWDATRTKLEQLLELLPEDILRKNVFKQPIIGRINIYQMLDFMQWHFDRHRKQVYRTINQITK